MAPPRKVIRQQLEVMVDCLEQNKDMAKGLPPGTPVSHHETRQKWVELAKMMNAVRDGSMKTPDGWKKYWFEWRHKVRKKAADGRRYQSGADAGRNRFVPLNDLEIRALELSGAGSVAPTVSTSQQLEDFLAEDSESEQPLQTIKIQSVETKRRRMLKEKNVSLDTNTRQSTDGPSLDMPNTSRINIDDDNDDIRTTTPPPKWAIRLEERRIAAEERMADALTSIAAVMRSQEERRAILDERIADALTNLAGTVQDLNSGVHEVVQHLQQLPHNGTDYDRKTFSINKIFCDENV